ncbi:MAG TPA: hypothetical protein VIL58_09570 [Thermoplasmata archaeon]
MERTLDGALQLDPPLVLREKKMSKSLLQSCHAAKTSVVPPVTTVFGLA